MASEDRQWTDEQLLLTAEEAARALNIGRTTLYALLKDGQLHSVHIGRSCRLTRAELQRYVSRLDASAVASKRAIQRPRRRQSADSQAGLFDLDPNSPDAA
ncbi:MAG: helix-turn-helix domain-containing protein [Actinobacteria bacterium]|nr:helix-turn-helix domain-containing protein [Actinomycetota bacterium]